MKSYLVKVGSMIDVVAKEIRTEVGILVEDGWIKEVKPFSQFSSEYEVVDYGNQVAMPGMINCHVHIGMDPVKTSEQREKMNEVEVILYAYGNMSSYLNSGVTMVRNQGTSNFVDLKLKKMIERNEIEGPTIIASGPSICMTGGHGHRSGLESDGEDECRKSARYLLKNGVDTVKFMATGGVMTDGVEPGSEQLSAKEVLAIVEEANKAGKLSSSHAQGSKGIMNVVQAGATSVEHGIYLTDEIIDTMVEKGIYLVPTLSAVHFILENGVEGGVPEYAVRKCEKVYDSHINSFKNAYQKGVKIAMGTDAGTPFNLHENSWKEFELMMQHGMTAMDALRSGTIVAAEMVKKDEFHGSIEAGKRADFIILKENPLENIRCLKEVEHVYKHGVKVK